MRKMIAAVALAVAGSLAPTAAVAQEPQLLPETSCNEGTEDARQTASEPAANSVPHEGRTGHCHHAVPSSG